MNQVKILSWFLEVGKREIVVNRVFCCLIGVVGFILLTALGAFVWIPLPFTPVPITLQTFFVLLAGAALGGRFGLISQAGYVTLGIFGLPVFAGISGGWMRILSPTGGYLLGFILAGWIVGRLITLKKRTSFSWVIFSMLIGSCAIYLLGTLHLALVTGCGIEKAIYMGVLPFIPGDMLKLIGAASVYYKCQTRWREIF